MFIAQTYAVLAFLLCLACLSLTKLWLRSIFRLPLCQANSPLKGKRGATLTLYGFPDLPKPPDDTAIGPGHSVTKLEAWMRFANLHYRKGACMPADAPKGQLPYIEHGGDIVADYTFIIKYLEATYGSPPAHSSLRPLNRHQQAIATACTAIVTDRLTQGLMYYRFVAEQGWCSTQCILTGLVPWLLRPVVFPYLRAKAMYKLYIQGLARHSQQDVNLLLHDDLSALSTVLGEKRYIVGDTPCEADAALFGVLDQVVYGISASPELKAIVQQYPLLYLHTRRIRDTFFPDKDPSLTGRLVYGKTC